MVLMKKNEIVVLTLAGIVLIITGLILIFGFDSIKISNMINPKIINSNEVKQKICGLMFFDCSQTDLLLLYDSSPSDLEVIDWSYNEDQLGDSYTGYIVTYKVGNKKYYILANVVEFEKDSSWEVEVVYHGTSLLELQQYLK